MAASEQASMDAAVRHVVGKYSPKGKFVGWLMMASILVDAWDLYSIAFVLVFHPRAVSPRPAAAWSGRGGHAGRRGDRRAAGWLAV
jgi:hypothetical protein